MFDARYSPVGPIAVLEDLHGKDSLGNYLLLLAHDVLAHKKRYKRLIKKVRKRRLNTFIIMDNSLIELGEAMPYSEVTHAAEIVDASVVMTPDVLGNHDATKELIQSMRLDILESGRPPMMVPQGGSLKELMECVDYLRDQLPIEDDVPEYWGIPRWIANELNSRSPIIQYIRLSTKDGVGCKIHLLGMSKNHRDDMRCARIDDVIGIDSANPLTLGFMDIEMNRNVANHVPRGDLWDQTEANQIVEHNIWYIRNAINP